LVGKGGALVPFGKIIAALSFLENNMKIENLCNICNKNNILPSLD
jgi:hypothetical protein